MRHINLKIPEHSYFFGFAQADGALLKSSRNRGRLYIELGEKDAHILTAFQKLFPLVYSNIRTRTRDTNFKKNYTSCLLTICDIGFRSELNKLGLPYGEKSGIISMPKSDFCERDYIRGLVDGDGSVGLTGKNFPFISFVIKSETLKDRLLKIIERIISERKKLKRNKRDNIYNIMLNRERAQQLVKHLYYPGCLALKRKLKNTRAVLRWERPEGMRRALKKFWERWEDEYILSHTIRESCNHLKRTKNSVGMRLWRFQTNKIST